MTKASPARRHRREVAKRPARTPANEKQQVDINSATPEQLRAALINAQAQIRVMQDEATLANRTITSLRTERLVLIETNQGLAKLLQKHQKKEAPAKK